VPYTSNLHTWQLTRAGHYCSWSTPTLSNCRSLSLQQTSRKVKRAIFWPFAFTQVDEFGFPYKGSLSFNGLESIIMPNLEQLRQMMPISTTATQETSEEDTGGLPAVST